MPVGQAASVPVCIQPLKVHSVEHNPLRRRGLASALYAVADMPCRVLILHSYVILFAGAREIPKQWKNGASFPTLLPGKDLKLNYAR